MKSGGRILGGFAATGSPTLTERQPDSFTTVLSGDIGSVGNRDDNSYHVVYNAQGQNASAVLDGVVIRDGSANEINSYSAESGGGGMYNVNSSPTLINCSFMNNYSDQGGGIYNESNSDFTLTNCSFINNSASFGGGMANFYNSNPSLINCSFLGNRADEGGSVIHNRYGGRPSLTNCVAFGNRGSNPFDAIGDYSSVTVTYSLLETGVSGYTDGGNNRTTAVSPFGGETDVRLKSCAPAIDAGNDAANATTTDVVGNARKVRTIDMGAVEYQGSPTPPLAITQQPPSSSLVCQGGTVSIPLADQRHGPLFLPVD